MGDVTVFFVSKRRQKGENLMILEIGDICRKVSKRALFIVTR